MKALIGHMGAWAPRPEQMATAWFLRQPERVDAYMADMNAAVTSRLSRIFDGIQSMKAEGCRWTQSLPREPSPPSA